MAADSAEHNLLFGVLAVQLSFVSREQFVEATGRWVLNKKKPLRDVFVERGVLSADEARLLDGVVQKHLDRYEGDARQSLQSIEAFDSVRLALGSLADAEVRSTVELETLGAAEPTPPASDAFSTMANRPMPEAASRQRYTVLRLHQKGGLGRVSVALDEELNREIALKEILPAHADNEENRNRFIREAEITGALEHPGVVPVYSLGQFADGRPYYAMRFIHGMNLQMAIEDFFSGDLKGGERQLAFRQLLVRFIHVCNAMDYAHSRGVVHRDLKPSNIMLGDYGETLVVDWGLAKSLGEDLSGSSDGLTSKPVTPTDRAMSTSTQMGRIVGTPPYMSPEQASGQLDNLGPRSDVYSLGATLYHIITGDIAFKGTEEEVVGNVQMGRFPRPRKARRDVPRALEAICLKAMARLPQDRYASARELADDMERFMGDERVHAYREPLPARAWRWTRSHKTLVMSGVATLTVAVVALTTGVILLGRANQVERRLTEQVQKNFEEADRQRQAAERNFRLARDAVRDYYLLVSEDTLLKQHGLEPLRDSLLQQALLYYQEFLKEREGDPGLKDEVASAHFIAGEISTTTGEFEQALDHLRKAAALQAPSAEAESPTADALADYGRTLNATGEVLYRQGDLEQAKAFFQRAVEQRKRAATIAPEVVEHARCVASSMMNLGSVEYLLDNPSRGIELLEQAQTLRLAHAGSLQSPNPDLQRDLGMGYYNLGVVFITQGESEAAENNLLLAADAFGKLLQQDPDDLGNQRRLAACNRMIGDFRAGEGRAEDAVAFYQKAVEVLEPLHLRHPFVPEYAIDLAGAYMQMGEQQRILGQADRALVALTKAVTRLRNLPEESAQVASNARDLGIALRTTGELLRATGRLEEARSQLEESQEVLSRIVRADSTDELSLTALDLTLGALAEVEEELSRPAPPPGGPSPEAPEGGQP